MSEGDGALIAGRYRLETQLGSGAMGVVWRAVDVRLDRPVAVKQLLLPPGLNETETEKARQRAAREGRIAARLQHSNAISVYNVVDHDGHPVLVMEYLPSRSLSAVLDERETLPPDEVARIGAQVAAALTVAHDAGVIHRDVKPGNILLADDGTAKITDFGISRAAGDITVTSTGLLAGTPAFLSPEAARGAEPGPEGDVFSLGATLYAAVEGRPPFENPGNEIAMLHVVAGGQVIPPQQAGLLDGPLRAMLLAEPSARPTMSEVETTLRAVAEGRAAAVDPPTLPPSPPVRGSTRVDLHPAAVSAVPQTGPPQQSAAASGPVPSQPTSGPTPLPAASPPPPSGSTPPSGPTSLPNPGRAAGPVSPPHGTAVSVAPSSGTAPAAQSRARTGLTALAVLAAAAVGVLIAELLVGGSDSGGGGDTPAGNAHDLSAGTSVSAPADSPADPPPESSASSVAESEAPTELPPEQLEQAVATYYSLLPDDLDQAWEGLGPAMREQGKEAYEEFWSGIDSVSISGGPEAVDETTVEVELQFTNPEKGVVRERHRLGLIVQDGRALIESDEFLSIVEVGDGSEDEPDEDEPDEDEPDEDEGG